MDDAIRCSPLAIYLEEYGERWTSLAEYRQVFHNEFETTLRIVGKNRDVTICFEYDCTVWICGSIRLREEGEDAWKDNFYNEGRESYYLDQFLEDSRNQADIRGLRGIRKLINRNNVKQCRAYLERHNEAIRVFVDYWLKDR